MHIAVCDDEDIFREYLKRLLLEYSFRIHEEIFVSEYASGQSLLEAYSSYKNSSYKNALCKNPSCQNSSYKNSSCKTEVWDVIFLDIRMEGMDGMKTAELLRAQGCGCLIVFLTSLVEYAPKGYEVRAFRYLLKEQARSDLGRVLDACRQELSVETYFSFCYERRSYSILKRDIRYFESRKRLVFLHAAEQTYQFYQKLDDLEKQLSEEGFLRCHRSFLVQERYVRSWRENALWLEDGTELPVSRTYGREVNRRLMLRTVQ